MKLYDENGNVVLLGDVIKDNFPAVLDNILLYLDACASDYDSYCFGLPNYNEIVEAEMKQIIVNELNNI